MGWGSYPSLNFDELRDLGKVPSPPWACLPPSVKQKDIYGLFQLVLPGSQHLYLSGYGLWLRGQENQARILLCCVALGKD